MIHRRSRQVWWSLLMMVSGTLLMACAPGSLPLQPSPHPVAPRVLPLSPTASAPRSYGRLPLAFEAYQEPGEEAVQFLARGRGYALLLTPSEAVLSLRKGEEAKRGKGEEEKGAGNRYRAPGNERQALGKRHRATVLPAQSSVLSPQSSGLTVRLQLAGANPHPRMEGLAALPGKVNYFLGNDPSQWRTNVQTYAKVKYHEVYPGIDVVYYGNQEGRLEHDFIVAPGADPSVIQFSLRDHAGAELPLTADAAGNLLIQVADATLQLGKPVVYQEIGGERREVAGSYVRLDPQPSGLSPQDSALSTGVVGFQVAAYDPAYPVVIDPVLSYSTYLGGNGDDVGLAIAANDSGQAYVSGMSFSTDLPLANALQSVPAGDADLFIAKLSADGSALLYLTYLGGRGYDAGHSLALDDSGRVYVTGETESLDFPLASPIQPLHAGGGADAFVVRLSADGSALDYATYLGGSGDDTGASIAVDSDGQAVVAGATDSLNFPTATPLQAAPGGSGDAFIVGLNAAGTLFRYATYLGGSDVDAAHAVAVDSHGNAYVAGETSSLNFPTMLPLQATLAGFDDWYVTKVRSDGAVLLYSTYLGGSDDEVVNALAVDGDGQASVAGSTESRDFPTFRPLQATLRGDIDAVVVRLSADGRALLYSTYLGGSNDDFANAVAVDDSGRAYIAGETDSLDFPTVTPLQPTSSGDEDAFVAQISANGGSLLYATYLGGSELDAARAVAVDRSGQVYVTGETFSADFPTFTLLQATNAAGTDGFVVKLEPSAGGDDDGDGVSILRDNCPEVANGAQIDTDGDGIGDACDRDDDNDGLEDADDSCPTVWNPHTQDDTRDDDGVPDACDNCPDRENADQLDTDGNGRGDACDIASDLDEPKKPRKKRMKPTDPAVTDSDNDGLTDAVETAQGLSPTNPDSDGDGVIDGADNCARLANADQADADRDGAGNVCDADDDGDFIADTTDNCPIRANTEQRNLDGDALGDVCDDDADGDTFRAATAGGDDCNDFVPTVHPGAREIPGNNRDDDCDVRTADRVLTVDIDFRDLDDPDATYDTWLPTIGHTVELRARVVDTLGQLVGTPVLRLNLGRISDLAGQYTNDANQFLSTDYEVVQNTGNWLVMEVRDFGGTVTMEATADGVLADGMPIALRQTFTLPRDTDADGLPDAWEYQFGELTTDEDFDLSPGNPYVGDGLAAFEEYRGFLWGPPLVRVEPNATYQTPAYVPQGQVQHFRSNPLRKDLFVKWTGYDDTNPFALGTVFSEDAGLDVHAAPLAARFGEEQIDASLVRNEKRFTYQDANGHINKRGVRDWEWDTKGAVDQQGDATTYGNPFTYQISLDFYFADRPYLDYAPGRDGVLNPVTASSLEDGNDNGRLDILPGLNEDKILRNGLLDGDHFVPEQYENDFSSLDIDRDGHVELPIVATAGQIDPQREYSKAHVLMHTITHEVGHAVGANHNQDAACLMYQKTPNWSRAGCLSPSSKAEIQIHNE